MKGKEELMPFARSIKRLIPLNYHLPISYYKHKFLRKLEPEMKLLPSLVGAGRRAIDVGANHGIYTYALSRLFESVEAFEPVPAYFRKLAGRCAPNVTVHNVALSNSSGSLHINVPTGDTFGESPSFVDLGYEKIRIEVPVRPLDDFGFANVSFIKIDVEGYESEVLQGAASTISICRPLMLIEIEQRHLRRPMTEIIGGILEQGYNGFFYRDSRLVDIAEFSYEKDQAPYLNDLRSSRYVNNFIFKPADSHQAR
jgi:FkbM family methyltransferase